MVWDKIERRKSRGRRVEDDLNMCPFHKQKCDEIHRNRDAIDNIKNDIVKREEFDNMKKTITPRWAFILFISSSITVGAIISAIVIQTVKGTHVETKAVSESMWELKANQKILMKTFSIEPVTQQKEAEDNEKIH